MKNIALVLSLVCFPAFADVIVIADSTGKVYTMSEEDDTEVPAGYTKSVIRGKTIETLELTQSPDMYDFKGDRFKLNTARVKDREDKEKQAALAEEEANAARVAARSKLAALGLSDAEIDAISGVK